MKEQPLASPALPKTRQQLDQDPVEDPVRRQRRLLATIRFSVYGLAPEWQGQRWLSSLAHFEDTVGIVSLSHGSQRTGEGALVRVESYASDALADSATDPGKALFRLMVLQHHASHPRATEDEYRAWSKRAQEKAANASRRETPINLAGEPVPFTVAADGPLWAAVPMDGEVKVIVLGIDEEPSQWPLVTVDPEEYLEGTVALARQRGQAIP